MTDVKCTPVTCLEVTRTFTNEILGISNKERQLLEVGMLVSVDYNVPTPDGPGGMLECVTGRIQSILAHPFEKNAGYLSIDISFQYHAETVSIKTTDIMNIKVLR